jgi:hypothetical protein
MSGTRRRLTGRIQVALPPAYLRSWEDAIAASLR